MKRTLRILLTAYYAVYAAAILAATSGYYILKSGFKIDPLTSEGTIINSIVILYIISTVPLALALFNKMTKKWALIQDWSYLSNFNNWNWISVGSCVFLRNELTINDFLCRNCSGNFVFLQTFRK